MPPRPSRGEIWLADLDPIRGHEQAGIRPVLVMSIDAFNHGPARLVYVVPLTRTGRRNSLYIPVTPPEGGLHARSFILCMSMRSVSTERLRERWGAVTPATLAVVADRLRMLLDL